MTTAIAEAERDVLHCKKQLRAAYERLRAERAGARRNETTWRDIELGSANARMEKFCADWLANYWDHRVRDALRELPVRQRFVMCALASGMTYVEVGAWLPKLSGKGSFVKMGITKGGLCRVIRDARCQLARWSP
jgi:hypothetical protein